MKLGKKEIQELITALGFKAQSGNKDVFYKNYPKHNNYVLKVDFEHEKIEYGLSIGLGDLTTSHFENSENFVVLECVDRVLEKGYAPDKISLEHKWLMGRKEKGKLDVLVTDKNDKAYLMIECKTWGEEYEKEKKKMQRDGGQLFSYFQQDKSAQYLCLYASRINNGVVEFVNDIIKVDEQWKELGNQKETFDHWNKNFKDNGVFDDWANAYDIEIKALTRGRLKELTEDDSGRIFNQFAEILRHNVVSDKPNAFNKIFNLFLCKIVDENRTSDEELKFQWLETDTDEDLQKRLSDLYKQGMKEYLTKEVTDYNDEQVKEKLYALDPEIREQIREMFTRVRLHKNNEFAFKEVFDEKSFRENAIVVREVVELLQPYQIRYGHKQQFLGDFFELLLSTGIKQEAGQFFTPVPIAKFIVSSLPIRELIEKKINDGDTNFLPYVIDYAAGSGHFLTEAMDEIQKIVEDIDPSKQRPSVKAKLKSWHELAFEWAYDFIYGIEADYRLVKTAKVSCFLNGDGLANVIHADGLDHFQKSIDYKGRLKEISHDDSKDNGQFDILVANPPYSVAAFKNTLKFGEESFDLFNRLTDDSSEIECLFIERTKQLLKPNGWAGVILPSSILNNSGIYTGAREIILKYFKIKAIAEFGSNTFMATGTNTVTLFLERRTNTEWKKVETAIKSFFAKPKEANINGIDKAFGKYVSDVFEGVDLADYITLVNKKPSEAMQKHELFIDYQNWFASLTEVRQIQEKKIFKDKTEAEQKAELEKIFYEKILANEQEKMLYFFLAHPQQTVLIKISGEKQAEKDFLGYEFSNRRGHEGIKMFRDDSGKPTTKLYDDDNYLNPQKANSYIYRSFLGQKNSIDESLIENISVFNLLELMDFKKLVIEKSITLGVKKKASIKTKWDLAKIGSVTNILNGGTPDTTVKEYWGGGINWATLVDTKEKYLYKTQKTITEKGLKNSNAVLLPKNTVIFSSRATIGDVTIAKVETCTNQGYKNFICDESKILHEYLYYILKREAQNISDLASGMTYKEISKQQISDYRIPLPPKTIQESIVREIAIVEKREKAGVAKIKNLKERIEVVIDSFKGVRPIAQICSIAKEKINPQNSPSEILNYIGLENIESDTGRIINFSPTVSAKIKSTKNVFEKGNVLYGKLRPYLNKVWIAEFDGVCSTDILVLKTKEPELLKQILLSKNFVSKSSALMKGINLPRLQVKDFMAFKVSYPTEKEMINAVKEMNKLEQEILAIESELSKTEHEKEQVLNKYLV